MTMNVMELMLYAGKNTTFILHDMHGKESWNGKYTSLKDTYYESMKIPYGNIEVVFFECVAKDIIHVYGKIIKQKYEYAERLFDSDIITLEEYHNWNDDKEKYFSIMDMTYDYLWQEDESGIHFTDRYFSDGDEDEIVRERRKNNELELHFNNFNEVDEWIKRKEANGEYIPNR